MTTFNQLVPDLVSRWQQLHTRLSGIDENAGNPVVRAGQRMDTIVTWRGETLPRIDHWLKVDVPAHRNRARQDAAEALTRIRAGRPLIEKQPEKRETDWSSVVDTSQQPATPERNRDVLAALSSMRDELLFQSQVANAITLHQLASTEGLAEVVAGYRTAAEDPDNFPVAQYRIDSVVLPPILRARADGGDARATFALQELEQVESALLAAAGLADVPARDGRVRDIKNIREAVDRLGSGGLERLEDLDAAIAPFARLLEHQRREAQQVA